MSKKYNFSAGPAILPDSVIKASAEAVANWDGTGLSLLEVSHRGAKFVSVLEEAMALTKELLGLPDNYKVLFLTGGASSQFYMTAMNLLDKNGKACYVDTGTWSTKAIKEAKLFGPTEVIASSKEQNFQYVPKGYEVPKDATYLHLTSNNTISGTQMHELPITNTPIVCDMSSDIFSRPIDIERYGLIYAGAQKNMGPAGTTLVIVREDMLGNVDREITSMLDYNTHIKKDSSFNTPPVFPIFVSMLTMRWIKSQGGVAAMAKHNEEKAAIIYNEIDRNSLFKGVAAKEDRSLMNVTFVATKEGIEKDFLAACEAAGCVGLKGHRSVGGFRASIYNAMSIEGVNTLAQVMQDFEKANA